jgi:hypothetical protein
MIRQELNKRSPLRILENTTHGGLGKKNIGIFASRPGEGKTACLVHFALDALLQSRKVLHVTFSENPDHIYSWYESIFTELTKAYKLEMASDIHDEIALNRMILNFSVKKLSIQEINDKISKAISNLSFHPEVIIVDGFNSENASEKEFVSFKKLAGEYDAELWFALALGGPASLNDLSPVISVIILLESTGKQVRLRLLRDHENNQVKDTHLHLNPTTLLIEE